MTEYTLDVNGKRYELNDDFRESIERRARLEYEENPTFTCWWTVAHPEDYSDEAWEENVHEKGDPILVIETEGLIVPWDNLDQLEATMPPGVGGQDSDSSSDETEELDAGNGMKTIKPDDPTTTNDDIFGRTHYHITPKRYDELPQAGGDDSNKVPPAPKRVGDEPELVIEIPRHPDVDHTWSTGKAITSIASWVEWNVQQRANQPHPSTGEGDSHDGFESLCLIHGCEKIGEYEPSDAPSGASGQVERKGEKAYNEGKYGGGHWNV